MSLQQDILDMLETELELGGRTRRFNTDTRLMGDVPELDSMAVAYVVAAMEDRFDIRIEHDEVGAELFATVGSLVAFVELKQAEKR
ncbi:acyl carrier protein [Thioalkalivibrio sp. ALJT]|uniref:acyl carrier protein n=1 Tax=Thioalkalivibrio sp. ALJT TaxID=1158146 RepID=UPI000377EB4A|nr:phosphopantetheine-binding protein [Thioalkalivibrio sp. ALJT]